MKTSTYERKMIMEGFLNIVFGYVILAVPALIIVLLFRRKSKKDLEKFDESKYQVLDHDDEK
ncbi:hypothetical protein BSG1_18965 [Bacillus sp. SG-1]|nr:hypothetical protein BSG1_18965 [Bacillus sp. SG-1]